MNKSLNFLPVKTELDIKNTDTLIAEFLYQKYFVPVGPCLRICLFGIADPGVQRVGRSAFFFFYKK